MPLIFFKEIFNHFLRFADFFTNGKLLKKNVSTLLQVVLVTKRKILVSKFDYIRIANWNEPCDHLILFCH